MATAETGTISMPRFLASSTQDVTASTVTSKAEPVPTAKPLARAVRFQLVELLQDRAAVAHRVDDRVARGEGHAVLQRQVRRHAARRRAVVEIEQAALAEFGHHRRHRGRSAENRAPI